jgi:peptidoglycan/LPS O-acetylase OafA/YrhL
VAQRLPAVQRLPATPRPARRPDGRAAANRISSLDGLRGVAALVVVIYHVFLVQPSLAAPHLDPDAPLGAAQWLATFTPLHLVWAGPEAVFVFFVLSGLVLALPVADIGRLNLRDYYPRRLLRLYLPVWAAVGLAVAWATAFPRTWQDGDSWWLKVNVTDPTPAKVLADTLLVWSPGQANHVLWSLQWEVIYCLLLPLVLVVVRQFPRLWAGKLLAVLAAIVVGAAAGSLALSSLSLFVLGTLMAVEHRRLAAWAARLQGSPLARLWWTVALGACAVLLLAHWVVHAVGVPEPMVAAAEHVARALQGLGAAGAVFLVWHWPTAQNAMTAPVMQWLGSRSFSLYLVHLPIAGSVAVGLGGQPPLLIALPLTLVIALPATELFYRFVERPSHRIARRAGRAVARRAPRRAAPGRDHALASGSWGTPPITAQMSLVKIH